MRGRRRATALVLCLALQLSGCQAYHSRYWSFPMNSMQMVESAARNDWTYSRALGFEFLSQLFPYFWLLTVIDVVLAPFTLPHDLIAIVHDSGKGRPFADQVRAERKRDGPEKPLSPNLESKTGTVPGPTPSSGFER